VCNEQALDVDLVRPLNFTEIYSGLLFTLTTSGQLLRSRATRSNSRVPCFA